MKAIQITMDERLLEELDSTDEARQAGRSAVIRRATSEYLERLRRSRVAERYRCAYGDGEGLGQEYEGWEDQGRWPRE